MKKTITYYIIATIAWCLILVGLFSCNPQRKINKAYNTVAANIPASLENKAKLGGWVNFHYSFEQKTIVKDSTIEKVVVSKVTDTITNVVDNTIYKYIYNRDTLVVERWKTKTVTQKDTVGNFAKWLEFKAVSDSLTKFKGNNYILNEQLVKANLRADEAESKERKLFWILILVAAVGFASHYLRNKLKF